MTTRQDASTGEMVTDDKGNKEPVDISKDPTLMHIKVYSPYQTYFDDVATSISGVNDTGPFDILKGHHRFLTLLLPCELVIVTEKGDEKIKISRGIMYVKEDRVTVFLDV
jgi:F0F1-type ATP synthase epsilon subunit